MFDCFDFEGGFGAWKAFMSQKLGNFKVLSGSHSLNVNTLLGRSASCDHASSYPDGGWGFLRNLSSEIPN